MIYLFIWVHEDTGEVGVYFVAAKYGAMARKKKQVCSYDSDPKFKLRWIVTMNTFRFMMGLFLKRKIDV